MIKRLLAFLLVPPPAVLAGLAAACSARGAVGRRVEAWKDYTTVPGDWKPLGAEGDASALDRGLRLHLA